MNLPNFDAQDQPVIEKVTRVVNIALAVAGVPSFLALIDVVVTIVLAIAVTWPSRYSRPFIVDISLVASLFVLYQLIGLCLLKFLNSSRGQTYVFGKSRFNPLPSVGGRLFNFILMCAGTI